MIRPGVRTMQDVAPHAAAGGLGTGSDPFRRGAGLALLAGLLLLLGVLAGVRGRVVSGDPTAAPVAAAPQLGDCITENPHTRGIDAQALTAPLPSLRTGFCTGTRFGEVVAVAGGYPASTEVPFADFDQCMLQAYAYVGIDPPQPPMLVGPAAWVWFAVVGPDDRQRAAGQDWSACVVYLPISVDAEIPITVDHSLRGAWQRPVDSRLFAICLDDPDTMYFASCGWPHRFELVSTSSGDPAATPESVQDACRQDAVQMLGSPAAFDRGDLTVHVVPIRFDETGPGNLITGPAAITADSEYFIQCVLAPTDPGKRLAAPLRGLGDAPVPLN